MITIRRINSIRKHLPPINGQGVFQTNHHLAGFTRLKLESKRLLENVFLISGLFIVLLVGAVGCTDPENDPEIPSKPTINPETPVDDPETPDDTPPPPPATMPITTASFSAEAPTNDKKYDGVSAIGSFENFRVLAKGGSNGADVICAEGSGRSNPWYWHLPLKFTGNISDSYNKMLRFQLKSDSSITTDEPLAILRGSNGTLLFHRKTSVIGADWTSFDILMTESQWTVDDSTENPSPEMMLEILNNTVELMILGSAFSGDDNCIGMINLDHEEAQPTYSLHSYFDSSAEGWAGVDESSSVQFKQAGGNPGGYICVENGGGNGFWAASDSFLRDLSSANGGALTFDLRIDEMISDFFETGDTVVIDAGNMVLTSNPVWAPGDVWKTVRVPLQPSHWKIRIDGLPTEIPTSQQFTDALRNIQSLYLHAHHYSGFTPNYCLDNVKLEGRVENRGPALYQENFDVDSGLWSIGGSADEIKYVTNGGYPDGGYICGIDGSSGDTWYWIAPDDLLAAINSSAEELLLYKRSTASPRNTESVRLTGNGTTLIFNELWPVTGERNEIGSWTAVRVPLNSPKSWVFDGTDVNASDAQLNDSLSNITELAIHGDFGSNATDHESCLDNVTVY